MDRCRYAPQTTNKNHNITVPLLQDIATTSSLHLHHGADAALRWAVERIQPGHQQVPVRIRANGEVNPAGELHLDTHTASWSGELVNVFCEPIVGTAAKACCTGISTHMLTVAKSANMQ